MQNELHAPTGAPTDFEVADVTLDKREIPPLRWHDELPDLVKVPFRARREIVQSDDPLAELEQGLHEVRTDEPGGAGDKPGFWLALQSCPESFVGSHLNSHIESLKLPGFSNAGKKHGFPVPSARPNSRLRLHFS